MTTSTKLDRRLDAMITAFTDACNVQLLAARREFVALGYLPGSIGAQPHAVALGVDMVEVAGERDGITWNLAPKIAETVADVVQGPHDLWFSGETGDAFLSFEREDDAVLFRLALDA